MVGSVVNIFNEKSKFNSNSGMKSKYVCSGMPRNLSCRSSCINMQNKYLHSAARLES